MIERLFGPLFKRANYAGKVVGFSALSRVAWTRVLRCPAKIFKRTRKVYPVIETNVGDRPEHAEVRIVALLSLEKIRERFILPAVQVSFLCSASKCAGFALELGKANFMKNIA